MLPLSLGNTTDLIKVKTHVTGPARLYPFVCYTVHNLRGRPFSQKKATTTVCLHCFKFSEIFRPYGIVSRFLTAIGRNISGFFLPMSRTFSLQISVHQNCPTILSRKVVQIAVCTVGGLFITIISHKLYKIEFSFVQQLKIHVRLTQYKRLEVSILSGRKVITRQKNVPFRKTCKTK